MNAADCNQRACECAAKAAIAMDEAVATEFLKLAGQWRAVGARQILLGQVGDPARGIDFIAMTARTAQ
jgi:hypothetical protein